MCCWLDPSQFQIMVAAAKAMLGSKVLDLNAEKLNYQRMLRDVEVKQAQVQADQANFDRLTEPGEVGRRYPRRFTSLKVDRSLPPGPA